MTANQKAEWQRWGLGILATVLIGLTVHIGNEGSKIKKDIAAAQAVQMKQGQNIEDLHEDLNDVKDAQKEIQKDIKEILKRTK